MSSAQKKRLFSFYHHRIHKKSMAGISHHQLRMLITGQ